MPALRDRASDIPALANVLLAKLCANQNCAMPEVDTEALAYISSLAFPGNVRELENMLERALALCDGNLITVDDLFIENALKQEIRRKPFEATPLGTLNLSDYLEDVEKKAIIQALHKTNNNKTAAAKLLGVTFRTLRYRLAKLGLSQETDS
jgi:two-component system response regulator PilR (NtrC family)